MASIENRPSSILPSSRQVKASCVHWGCTNHEGGTNYDTESWKNSCQSPEITFEKERYFFRCMFTDGSPKRPSQLALYAADADGRPRRPRRPFHVSVFVWGSEGEGERHRHPWQRIDRTCSLLAQGTVSEVPWIPDYDQDFLQKQTTTISGFGFAVSYHFDFLLVFESSSVKHDNTERPIQTECARGTSKDSEFPSNLENLSLDFANLLKNETLSDVKLKCGSRDRTIPAHRAVLAARSKVFAAMLRNEMAESQSGDVDVVDVDDDVIDPFLQYVYSGKIPSCVSDDVVPGLYAAADEYAVHALRETCQERMVRGLTEENCVTFLTVADAHYDSEFKESVIDYICSHETVLKGDAWREFAKKQSPLAIEVYDSFVERKTSAISLNGKPK